MESEKVKEIKKALEENANYEYYNKLGYIDGYTCKTVAYADILTYINELESENDTLHTNLCEWRKENQQLKDRIDELEKENQSLKESIEYGNEVCKECQSDKDKGKKWNLKQFAEELKEICTSTLADEDGYIHNAYLYETIDDLLKNKYTNRLSKEYK